MRLLLFWVIKLYKWVIWSWPLTHRNPLIHCCKILKALMIWGCLHYCGHSHFISWITTLSPSEIIMVSILFWNLSAFQIAVFTAHSCLHVSSLCIDNVFCRRTDYLSTMHAAPNKIFYFPSFQAACSSALLLYEWVPSNLSTTFRNKGLVFLLHEQFHL
jgi:hypothetical protein